MFENGKTKQDAALSIAAMRSTTLDVINKANSGHPGMALDAAPAVYALFRDHLTADPKHPDWINRDRFVLSCGHVSSLLYTTLHCLGYSISMEDLKSFRQLGSITPGHPEVGMTPGVDATSGPLGQGIAQAVGMAMAEKAIEAEYPEGSKIMNHWTYCLCGDGCLEEGISHEAISLAGHYHLNKLVLLYDENGSTLDGPTSDSASDNVKLRFFAAGWDVIEVKDGNNWEKISKAISKAKENKDFPTLIIFHTQIGYGSEHQGSHVTHGAPLTEEDTLHAKKVFGYDYPPFTIPDSVYSDFASSFGKRGAEAYEAYQSATKEYKKYHSEAYELFQNAFARNVTPYLPENRDAKGAKPEATRNSSGKFLERLTGKMPFTFGGSADVAGSTKTNVKGLAIFDAEHPEGRDVHFGIREFGMASAQNGILLHGGLLTYCATFFVFSDYLKPAIRMAAMENIPSIYILTHDSIAVGEDGTTHEPIEQLASLRSIPNVDVIRPADINETEAAWRLAVESKTRPTALILTRQNLPQLENSTFEGVQKGAYVVYTPSKKANIQLIATGSEVSLCIAASKILEEKEIYAEVVSMPSWNRFVALPPEEKEEVLHLPYDARVSVEMGSTFGWGGIAKYNIGIDEFGASGKAEDLLEHFGFTPIQIAGKISSFFKE